MSCSSWTSKEANTVWEFHSIIFCASFNFSPIIYSVHGEYTLHCIVNYSLIKNEILMQPKWNLLSVSKIFFTHGYSFPVHLAWAKKSLFPPEHPDQISFYRNLAATNIANFWIVSTIPHRPPPPPSPLKKKVGA